jgi:spermidine/putrescine transport system substrate-binding protein
MTGKTNNSRFAPVTRRRFVAGASTLGLAVGMGVGPFIRKASASGEVKVLNWQGYGTDEPWALEAFKAATGLDVVHDYYNSESEMITKLQTNPGTYDVIVTNSAWNGRASELGVIQPVDSSLISNFGDLNPSFRDSAALSADGKLYGVSWVWGMTAIAYSTDVFKEAPTSVEILWDPGLAKRVCVRDDAIEAVSFAAIATGQDMNHPADLARVKEKLLALKPNLATMWSSEDDWNKQFQAKAFDVSIYWSGSAFRSRNTFNLPVGYFVPKEGAIGWFDGLAIGTDAPNVEGAHKFIDYMVSQEFYSKWAEVGPPASANNKAMAALPDSDPSKAFYLDQENVNRLQFMAPLSDEERQSFSDLWAEVKTEFAK